MLSCLAKIRSSHAGWHRDAWTCQVLVLWGVIVKRIMGVTSGQIWNTNYDYKKKTTMIHPEGRCETTSDTGFHFKSLSRLMWESGSMGCFIRTSSVREDLETPLGIGPYFKLLKDWCEGVCLNGVLIRMHTDRWRWQALPITQPALNIASLYRSLFSG